MESLLRVHLRSTLALALAAGAGACGGGREAPEPVGRAPTAPVERAAGDPAPGAAPAADGSGYDPSHPEVGGVRFLVPAPFDYRPASSSLRRAEYTVEGSEDAVLVVFALPAREAPRVAVARWVAQMTPPEGQTAAIEEEIVAGLRISRADVRGTYQGPSVRLPRAGRGEPRSGHRLLAAAVETPTGGAVGFKLVGPETVVEGAEGAFAEVLGSVRVAPDAP